MNEAITRRTLARGTAWAVPAVTLAAAAPRAAASPLPLGIQGSSNVSYGDYYRTTQPLVTDLGGASFTTSPSGATATFTNVSIWYYLPWSSATFRRYSGDTRWSTLTRDSSVTNITSSTTGNVYYAYKTTFAGPLTTSAGPSYGFQATSALPVSSRFTGGYYYHIEGTVNGVKDTSRPYRPVTPTGCSPACSAP